MRRSLLVLSSILAVSTALLSGCTTPEAPKPTPASPTPVATASPVASPAVSPTASPTGSPVKSPDNKNGEVKNVNKDVKPTSAVNKP